MTSYDGCVHWKGELHVLLLLTAVSVPQLNAHHVRNVREGLRSDTSFPVPVLERYSNGNEAIQIPLEITETQAGDIHGPIIESVGEPAGEIELDIRTSQSQPLNTTQNGESFRHHSTPRSFCRKRVSVEMQGCGGESNAVNDISWRIVGGAESIRGRWPWMVSLYHRIARQHMCGATLIDSQWLLTARHCFNYPFNVTSHWLVRVGEHNRTYIEPNERTYQIRRIIGHSRFDIPTLDYDIALIELDRPVRDRDTPICLPTSRERRGETCMALGWGTTRGTGSRNVLREVTIPVVRSRECRNYEGYTDQLTRRMLCAGYQAGGHDTCQGDSGGPLQCLREGRWTIVGVASWGGARTSNCGEPNEPSVFTRVHSFRKWLSVICPRRSSQEH